MLDEQFKEYCATHDSFIYKQQEKICRIEIFHSIAESMRICVDEIDLDNDIFG